MMSLKFSQDIKLLLISLATRPIKLGEVLEETAERGFSLIIALLVLPFLLPMPPGLSGVMGIGCLVLGMQMALGRRHPFTVWLEKIVRSRWQQVANNSYTWRVNGCCITWLSILLMLPIPLTNPLPAIAILLLAIANIEADGLLMCIGYLLTLFNTILFGFMGYALWQTSDLFTNLFK